MAGTAAEMTGNVSETESETSSLMGDAMSSSFDASALGMKPPSPASREQLAKRIESLVQENRVLKVSDGYLEISRLRANVFCRSKWKLTNCEIERYKRRIEHYVKPAF